MSLTCVFVALARRLGLDASPVGFPYRIIAHVAIPPTQTNSNSNSEPEPEPEPETHCIYVDPFNPTAPISSLADLHAELDRYGYATSQRLSYLRPADAVEMFLRTEANILTSLLPNQTPLRSRSTPAHFGYAERVAIYATTFALLTYMGPERAPRYLDDWIPLVMNAFPGDFLPIMKKFALPRMLQNQDDVEKICGKAVQENGMIVEPRRRQKPSRHFLGQLVYYGTDR